MMPSPRTTRRILFNRRQRLPTGLLSSGQYRRSIALIVLLAIGQHLRGQDAAGQLDSVTHLAKEVAALREHTNAVLCLALSADGKTLVSGSNDLTVKVWDLPARTARLTLRGHDRAVEFVAVTPDGKTVASADHHGVIRLWDAVAGRETCRLTGPNEGVCQLTLSSDGTTLAAAMNDDCVRLWNVASGKLLKSLDYPANRCWSLAISPSVQLLSWGDRKENKRLRLFDIPSGKEWPLPEEGKDIAPQNFSADSKTLVVIIHSADLIELREVVTGMVRTVIPSVNEGHLQNTALHPGGRILATCYGQGSRTIRLWDTATGTPSGQLVESNRAIDALAFSADGNTLAAAEGPDTTIRVWDVSRFWAESAGPALLTERELETLWSGLADRDAAKAYQVMLTLAASPRQAAAMIGRHLAPPAAADPERTAPLIADLGSDEFAVRDAAMHELEALGDSAGPSLTRVLATRQLLETHHRAKALLDKLHELTPDRLRGIRAIESLEHAGGPEARRVLGDIVVGVPESRLSQEAKAALARLTIREVPKSNTQGHR